MSKPFFSSTSRTPFSSGVIAGRRLFFFDPDRGGTSGGGGGGGAAPQGDQERQQLQGLLQRHNNDAMAVIATLLAENHTLRGERRDLRERIPGQGAVVLTAEQATQWQTYQQLGAPDALRTQLDERETAQKELGQLRRERDVRAVAEVVNYKANVLLDRAQGLELEVAEVEENGAKQKRAFVKSKDGQRTRLEEYAQANWADYLPALQVEQQPKQAAPAGTSYVRQSAGGKAAGADPVSNFVSATYEVPKLRGQQ